MTNKNMTKAQAMELNTVLAKAIFNGEIEISEKLQEIFKQEVVEELVEKNETMHVQEVKVASRKRSNKGLSKVAKEKLENMDKVRQAFVEVDEAQTLTEIGILIGLESATPQKLSAIMKPLVDNGEFEKTTKDKKVAFQVAGTKQEPTE